MLIQFPPPRLQGVAKLPRCASTARYDAPRYSPTDLDQSAPNRAPAAPTNDTPQAVNRNAWNHFLEHLLSDQNRCACRGTGAHCEIFERKARIGFDRLANGGSVNDALEAVQAIAAIHSVEIVQ